MRLLEQPRNITNSLKTFPYAIQKHLAMHQSDFTWKYPIESLKDQCKLVFEEIKKTAESTNGKNETKMIRYNRILITFWLTKNPLWKVSGPFLVY